MRISELREDLQVNERCWYVGYVSQVAEEPNPSCFVNSEVYNGRDANILLPQNS